MAIEQINIEIGYVAAAEAVDALWCGPDGSPEVLELGQLVMLVEIYENYDFLRSLACC